MPVFIRKLILCNWRAYKGFRCIAFHEKSGMTALLGCNGSGKTSLLDAVAFVSCSSGAQNMDVQDASKTTYVAVVLSDNTELRRYANDERRVNNTVTSAYEYERVVDSKLKCYYITQLERSKDFFEPANLARFIETEELVNVRAPPLTSLEMFSRLENEKIQAVNAWAKARGLYLSARTEARAARKDLKRLRRSQKLLQSTSAVERRILVLRKLQIEGSLEEVRAKLEFIERGRARLRMGLSSSCTEITEFESALENTQQEIESSERSLRSTEEVLSAAMLEYFRVEDWELSVHATQIRQQSEIEASETTLRESINLYENLVSRNLVGGSSSESINPLRVAIYWKLKMKEYKSTSLLADLQRKRRLLQQYEGYSNIQEAKLRQVSTQHQALEAEVARESQLPTKTSVGLMSNSDQQQLRTTKLKQLEKIEGVIGLLRNLVVPKEGYQSVVWALMGVDADVLVVRDEASVSRCAQFLKYAPFTVVCGIVAIESVELTENTLDADSINMHHAQAVAASELVDVSDSPYREEITQLATKNAIFVPDLSHASARNLKLAFPQYTYSDLSGTVLTPENCIRRVEETEFQSSEVGRTEHSTRVISQCCDGPNEVPLELSGEISSNVRQHAQELDLLGHTIQARLKQQEEIREEIFALRIEVVKANEAYLEHKKVHERFDDAFASDLNQAAIDMENGASVSSHERISAMMAVESECEDYLVDLRQDFEKASVRLKRIEHAQAQLVSLKAVNEERKVKIRGEVSLMKTRQAMLLDEIANARFRLLHLREKLLHAQQRQSSVYEQELGLADTLAASFAEDEYHLAESQRATQDAIDKAYETVPLRTRHIEEAHERARCRHHKAGDLVKSLEAELQRIPKVFVASREVERLERVAAQCQEQFERATAEQQAAMERMDEAEMKLGNAIKVREERMRANLAELSSRAANTYQAIMVSRRAAPRITRLQMIALDKSRPWKGVMCTCHPVGKQNAPVTQLSQSEMAVAALCIKMSAVLGDGTKLVLYDEVDADLDALTCNALGNFIRRRTASPGGGQALIATHKDATLATAHNYIGTYRISDDATTQLITLRPRVAWQSQPLRSQRPQTAFEAFSERTVDADIATAAEAPSQRNHTPSLENAYETGPSVQEDQQDQAARSPFSSSEGLQEDFELVAGQPSEEIAESTEESLQESPASSPELWGSDIF